MVPGGRPGPGHTPAPVAQPSLYARTRSAFAWAALPAGSFWYSVPVILGLLAAGSQMIPSLVQVPVGLSPTSPPSVVMPAELELVRPAPATATKVASERRLIGAWQSVLPVVKPQTLFAASALPVSSFTPVVTVAVNEVLVARLLAGVKVAVWVTPS